jgi:acetyl esterase/lipase
MIFLYLLLAILIGYGLLYWLVPKGNPLHEIIQLPAYLAKTLRIPVKSMLEEKHRYGNHPRQYLLFFKPTPKTPKRNQVILYLHGGGWQFGKPEMFRANAKVFTDQGYAVFCISYRRIPFHDFSDIHEDLSNGLTKVLQLMEADGLGGNRICLGGMSAGAHLVAMLLYDRENLAHLGLRADVPSTPRSKFIEGRGQTLFSGIFLCGAPLDLRQMRRSITLRALAGKRNSPSFKRANPIEFLQADEQTPVLAIHATRDGLVEYAAGQSFAERLKEINPNIVQFHTIENGIHLEAGTWVMEDNEIRKMILNFVERLD